jgi:hypothetical protein
VTDGHEVALLPTGPEQEDNMGTLMRMFLPALCLIAPLVFLVSLAAFVRLLPQLLTLARPAWRMFLMGSFRLYHMALSALSPWCKRQLGLDLLTGLPRLVAMTLMSVVLGALVILAQGWSLSAWTLGPFVLHGLTIGLIWNDLLDPSGLRLGGRVP